MQEKISIQTLSTTVVPVLGHSVKQIQLYANSSGAPWGDFASVMLTDPGMCLEFFRKVGANKNSLRSDYMTIAQSTMLLGVEKVVQCVNQLPRLELMKVHARQGLLQCICRSHLAASFVWQWACTTGDTTAEQVYLAALLHDMAEMVLWKCDDELMLQLYSLLDNKDMPRDEAEYLVAGNSLEHYSRELVSVWNLPPFFNLCLRPENFPQPRIQGVMLAVQLARVVQNGWYTNEVGQLLEQIAAYLKISVAQAASDVHQVAVEAAQLTPFYKNFHAAALLPMLVAKKPKAVVKLAVPPATIKATSADHVGIKSSAKKTVSAIDKPQTSVCLTPQLAIFEQTVKDLESNELNKNISDLMRAVIHGMHDGIGLNRVLFAILDKDKTHLLVRYMVGTDNDPLFSRFKLDLKTPHLFARLLEKPQSVWINDKNRKTYWPMVPMAVKQLIKTNSFLARSLHINDKPIGLFYADRHTPNCELDALSYDRFRRLCQLAEKQLSQ